MQRSREDENEAIKNLIETSMDPLSHEEARAVLEKNGWDVDRAAQALMMASSIVKPDGGLFDSRVERGFRQDQMNAAECDPVSVSSGSEGPVVLNFGQNQMGPSSGPVVIQAVPTHTMDIKVIRVSGDNGEVSESIMCSWNVASGLPVTDIVLYPYDSEDGCNPVAHKYADGDSRLKGSVRFDKIDRGLYDIRIYNRKDMKKPLAKTESPIIIGNLVSLDVALHDGNALRITVSTKVDGASVEVPVKSRDWIGLFHAEEKDNTVLLDRHAYKYCSEMVDRTLELRLPRETGKYQVRFFDGNSPKTVCCGRSEIINFTPTDKLEGLSYNSVDGILRVQWSCVSQDPSNWFWVGLYSGADSGDKAKRETWKWCTKGKINKNGDSGLVDLELPQDLAKTVSSRDSHAWEKQNLELRFFVSSSDSSCRCHCPLPVMPPESSISGTSVAK